MDDAVEIKVMNFFDEWVKKKYPKVPRDKKWHTLKARICKKGEQLNPIMISAGGEIEVEQFGIIGSLFKKKGFYQCPLIESREQGTGKFGEWLQNVKHYVATVLNSRLALINITNQHLYKYCEKYEVPVAVDGNLYRVQVKK
ncbi:hypothetical protein KA005_44525 [bacterium]|nr:hypothetical protein [bacterium]